MSQSLTARDWLFTAAVCLGFVIVQLDITIVNVGLESLRDAFAADISDLEWVINIYSLLFAAFLLSAGPLGARFGVKKLFLGGVAIFIAASFACAFATSLTFLYIARGIQGFGASLLVPASLTLLRLYFDDAQQRASAIAMWAALGAVAVAAGPVLGGLLIKLTGWKSIFLINVPLGIISIAITARFAPRSATFARNLNLASQASVAIGLGLLTFALTESSHFGWTSAIILVTLVGGLLFLALFIRIEQLSRFPIIELSILKNALIVGPVLIGWSCNLVFYGGVFIFSIFFQSQMQLSPLETGFAFLPMMGATCILNYSSSWMLKYFQIRTLSLTGCVISFIGFGTLLLMTPQWHIIQMFIPMMLLGGGTSFAMPAMTNLIFKTSTEQEAGSASALFSCGRQMGGVVGVAIFGFLIALAGPENLLTGLKLVCGTAMIICLIWGAITAVKIPKAV